MREDDFYLFLRTAFSNAAEVMREGASFYIWHADSGGLTFRQAAYDADLEVKQNLIWVKNHFTIGRQDYQWQHEPCLYGWKPGAAHHFIDLRSLPTIQEYDLHGLDRQQLEDMIKAMRDEISTVHHEDKPSVSALHPTMKPLSLVKKHIRNSSKEGDVVLDLFGGSGTTLMACEAMGRTCYMMEYDPHFADIIIDRWEAETGHKAVLIIP